MDPNLDRIDIRQLALKCRNKHEVYQKLTVHANLYLPKESDVNSDFIADILQGRKKYIHASNINHMTVPHIEGLRVSDIVEYASQHFDILNYLPEYKTPRYPSRKWICNLVGSIIEDDFRQFIQEQISAQEDAYREKRNKNFEALPDFISMIKETDVLSTSSRFLENDQNSSSYLDEGGTGMNRQHFIKGRSSSKISMMNAKHKTSLSLSRFTGNQSLSVLRGKFGRNKSLLNYKDSKQDFDTKHKHTMAEIILSVTKCLKIREAVEDQYINEDKLKLLNKENKVLRTNVKKLNEYLSSFLIHVKEFKQKTHSSMSYKYGSHGNLKKNKDEKLKAQDQETQNYSKMLKNLREEHLKTKNRVFQVQDPRYILNLKKEVKETKEKIREMTSENTNLKAQEFSTNKKLGQVLHQGKNDAMNKISQLLKDLMALEERKSKYDKKIEFQIKTEIDIDEEIQNSKARANEIEQKARQEGLLDQEDDQYSPLYSPERVKAMKQKIEKHSLSAIHRKFFTKIIKQKK